MDIDRIDPDDDVTVVGDHELVVELRRAAAQVPPAGAAGPPPPPAPTLARRRGTTRSPGALRRPAPAAPAVPETAGAFNWCYDEDDQAGRSGLVWVGLAALVTVAVVVALLVAR